MNSKHSFQILYDIHKNQLFLKYGFQNTKSLI